MRITKQHLLAGALGLCVLSPLAAIAWGSPARGVTPTLIARGTYEPFKVMSDNQGPVDFQAKSKSPMDVVVRRHSYAPGGYTGWHSHPGPVFITVLSGELTFYEYAGGRCRKVTLTATPTFKPGYVDDGRGHFVRNESGAPAEDLSVIMAPTNAAPFRGELDPPEDCGTV